MPELRIVVLALQDRLAYGPTFETALSALFGESAPSLPSAPGAPVPTLGAGRGAQPSPQTPPRASAGTATATEDTALIEQAARDLADYQRLTAEGRLAEAGAKLENVKRTLDELQRRKR
jgi:hypothetical protein